MSIAHRVPAGSRRFWVTVVCFAVANCAAWVVYDRVIQPRRHPLLNVLQFDPGDGSTVSSRPTLTWNFNLDVAAPAPNAPAPGQIAPPVAGRWQWKDARTLTFEPAADLPAATPFTISLGTDHLRTPEGFRLARPYVCSFHTDPLSVLSVSQSAFDEADHLVLAFKFSDKVIPADLEQHLTISGSDEKPVKFHLHGDATAGTLHIMTDPIGRLTNRVNSWVQVHISPGLAGSAGPLGLENAFSAQVAVTADLQSESARAWAPASEEPYISVNFNNAIDLAALREVISIEPAANISISSEYGNSAVLRGGLQPGTRYAVKIAKAPAHSGTRQYPAPTTLSVFVPDREPGVWLEHTEGYLSPAGNRTVKAHAVNVQDLKVSVSRVYENNIVVWRNASDQRNWRAMDPYGRPLADRQIHLPLEKNKVQDLSLAIDDLLPADAMRDGVYQIDISSRPTEGRGAREMDADDRDEKYSTLHASSMVTLSDIGITAKQGHTGLNVWATSLRTAKPLENVRMRLYSNKNQPIGEAVTDADGLARIARSQAGPGEIPSVILADMAPKTGTDSARGLTWLDLASGAITFADADTSGRPYLRNGYEAFVYSDRGVYRPGEIVHLRAIVRGADSTMPAGQFPVRWQIRRPDLRNWKAQTATIDADGATSFDLQLPADLPTGQWSAHVGLPDNGPSPRFFGLVSFQVEEFMPNRMKVALDVDAGTPMSPAAKGAVERILIGDKPLVARMQADYLFGRPVTERPAALVARADPIPFSPPQWQGWSIGDTIGSGEVLGKAKPIGHRNELPDTELDEKGRARWEVNIAELIENGGQPVSVPVTARHRRSIRGARSSSPAPAANRGPTEYAGPWRVTLSGSVTETGGRAVSATRQIDVDLIPSYIAMRSKQTTVLPNAPAAFDVAIVKPDGSVNEQTAALEAELFQETWNESLILEQGLYHFQSTRVLDRVGKDSPIRIDMRGGRGVCTVTPPGSGSFVLRVKDPASGFVTACEFYAGDRYWNDNISRENPEKLELIVEPLIPAGVRETWNSLGSLVPWPTVRDWLQVGGAPGGVVAPDQRDRVQDWAQVIVRSPFAGRLLLSVETDDVLTTRVIDMPASNMIVPIRLPRGCRPNAYVIASVIRPVEPDAAWRTHRAVGVARLLVDTSDQRLNVAIAAPEEIRPLQSLPVRMRITDAAGNPIVNAAVTVAAVDEGICQLTGFATPDPFSYFTGLRALGVGSSDLYSQLMPETQRPTKTSSVGGDGGDALGDARHRSPVSAHRVKPVALFSGVVHTDERGLASADFPVPSFTGQLRVMAVASAESRFGASSAPVLVRSPLLVQSSWPRFAAPGDRFTVPLTIFNNSRADGQAAISIQWIDEAGGAGPIGFADTQERRLDLAPAQVRAGGQAVLGFNVITAAKVGVAHVHLSGEMNGEKYEETLELPVRPPSPEITLGGYAAAIPATALKISLPGGMLEGTTRYEVRVSPWPTLQLPQGLDYLDHYPYGCVEQTTSTLFPLVYLPDIGAQIAPGLFDKDRINEKVQVGITRLIGMQTADGGLAMWPGGREPWPWASVYTAHFLVEAKNAGYDVPDEFREHLLRYVHSLLRAGGDEPDNLETQAYACYVLALAGKPERPTMSRLDETLKNSEKRQESDSQARFHLAAAWLAAGRRDLGAAMIPQTLPAPREERELSGNIDSPIRERAVLLSTLLEVQPDHPEIPELARQLADAGQAGRWHSTQEIAFAVMALGQYLRQAQSVEPYQTADLFLGGQSVASAADGKPIVWQAPAGFDPEAQPLELHITGDEKSKAHVTWIQTGVSPRPPADCDHGLKVRRRYLDSHGDPIRNGVVRSGDLVIVEMSLESTSPLDHVVVEDLLPAGLEVENPRLLTTDAGVAKEGAPADDKSPVFEDARLDMKDDRLIVVGHLNSTGIGMYRYAARAVTSGVFVTPPVRAECMYDIGTSSLSGGGATLTVLPVDAPRVVDTGED